MTRLAALGASLVLLTGIASCTPDDSGGGPSPGGSGGSSGSGSGGRGGGGGTASGSGGSASGSGGSASGSGGSGSGGATSGGTGGSPGASGGAGGSGGGAGDAAPGEGGSAPVGGRSPGCGKPKPAMIPATLTTQGAQQPIIIRVPATYDPAMAYPLVFGFHGAGLRATDCQGGNCAGVVRVMGEKALLVFMQSFGGNWEGAANREKNVTQFSDALKYMRESFCVDEGHIAAVGSSSGATFSNILGCRFGDILRTVSPVAGSVPEKTNCKGTPPTIVIHGVSDNFAGGQSARDWYAMRNGCGMDTTPPMAAEIAKVQAARAATPRMEIHACSSYTTCTGAPVRFCAHSVGGYDGSTHGWPPIGGQLIWDFLMEQK